MTIKTTYEMASIKNNLYINKIFTIEDNGCKKYFLVTGYNKMKNIYNVIECYPDGEPMTSGYQGNVLASNMKKVNFIDSPKNEEQEESFELTPTRSERVVLKKEPKKEDKKQETKKESPKEEDPVILSWKNMKLRY